MMKKWIKSWNHVPANWGIVHESYGAEGVYPNETGGKVIAETIFEKLKAGKLYEKNINKRL